jgi:HAMP domain-containing protein
MEEKIKNFLAYSLLQNSQMTMFALKSRKLGSQLNLILVATLMIAMLIGGGLLSYILEINTEKEVANQAFLMIETMNSVRNYTSNQVKPELESRLATETKFIPETVPAYSAREVFEQLRKKTEYRNFFYKEATLNPTNPRDQADQFETEITEQFRQNSELSELKGFRVDNGQEFYYIARPLAIQKASCLECHSTPEKAPANLINTYGSDGGFGWKLNEIVASQIISVPAATVYANARKLQILVLLVVVFFFIIAIVLTNLFVQKSVISPLKNMANLSSQISNQDVSVEEIELFNQNSNDEIGILAKSLNRMILNLQMAIKKD